MSTPQTPEREESSASIPIAGRSRGRFTRKERGHGANRHRATLVAARDNSSALLAGIISVPWRDLPMNELQAHARLFGRSDRAAEECAHRSRDGVLP